MAILGIGAESDTITRADGAAIGTTASGTYIDTNIVRAGFEANRQGTIATPLCSVNTNSPVSNLWVHYRASYLSSTAIGIGHDVVLGYHDDGAGTKTNVWKLMGASATELSAHIWVGGAWIQVGTPFTIGRVRQSPVDIHVTLHATAGTFDVFENDISIFSFSGAMNTDVLLCNNVHFSSYAVYNAFLASYDYVSEIILADEPTIGMRLITTAPTGDSSTVGWTGTFADVDEINHVGDTTSAISDTAAADIRFTHPVLPPAYISGHEIKAVAVSGVYSLAPASVTTNIQPAITVNATDYTGALINPTADNTLHFNTEIWQTNPNTLNAWTEAEVNAMTYGARTV